MTLKDRIDRMLTRGVYGRCRNAALTVSRGAMSVCIAAATGCASTDRSAGDGVQGSVDAAMVSPADSDAVNAASQGGVPDQWDGNEGVEALSTFAARLDDGTTDASRRLVIEHVKRPGDGRAGEWTIRRRLVKGQGEGEIVRVQYVARLDDGSVVLIREENMVENVEVVFEPPMIVMPPMGLVPAGQESTQAFTMTVHPLGDRQRVRARGEATNTIHMQSANGERLRLVDSEVVPAWRIVSELHAKLTPADVRNVTVQWFAQPADQASGLILLAERREERTKVMGIQTRNSIERWVREAETSQ